MAAGRALQKARFAAGLPAYLRDPLTAPRARQEVRERIAARDDTFVQTVDRLMLRNPRSPYRALLLTAGWSRGRLEESVGERGVEATLEALREDGVWLSADEIRCRTSIRRGRLHLEPQPADFDNPVHMGRGIRGRTSSTTGAPTRVAYDWGMFAEEAALELLLFEAHGLGDSAWAMWLPALPSMSGIHNLFVHLRFRRPPERWFTHLEMGLGDRAMLEYVRGVARLRRMVVPLPEHVPPDRAPLAAEWLSATRDRDGRAALKTFASSAVRVARAAQQLGLDLSGCVIFAGGEPLTERRRSYIESTGSRVFARYVATETGWIGGACGGRPGDGMHLYTDRIAAIEGDETEAGGRRLLITTLSATTAKLLLNGDLGDAGEVRRGDCTCALATAGLHHQLGAVRPHDKLSGEGMGVPVAILSTILDDVVARAGGAPDSWQITTTEDQAGGSRVLILLSPEVGLDDREVVAIVLDRLRAPGTGYELAADAWREAGVLAVRRQEPALSTGFKHLDVGTRRRLDPVSWSRVYERGADDVESIVFRRSAEVARRLCLAAARPGASWADVGCGTGHLAAALSAGDLSVTGIDQDPAMVEAAAGRWIRGARAGRLRFVVGRAEELPFGDRELDGIVATSLVGCLAAPEGFFAEARRTLRPGGTAVITFTNRSSILHRLPHGVRPRQPAPDGPVLPGVRLYRPREAVDMLAEAGFEVERVHHYNFFAHTRIGLVPSLPAASALERWLRGVAASALGRNLVAVARRSR